MWIVALHSGGGSTVEAADPIFAVSYAAETDARAADDMLGKVIMSHPDPYVRQEWFTTLFEVHDIARTNIPRASPVQLAEHERLTGRKLGKNEVAFDLSALIDKLRNEEEIEILPEPVSPEDEAAAIASITGAQSEH